MLTLVFLLLICHYIGDFTGLSTPRMLAAKATGTPLFPIFLHAMVHGILMMSVLLFFVSLKVMLLLGCFQVGTHFLIDIWKGKMNIWFPLVRDNSKKWFWIIFGFDQLLHQSVVLLMVAYVFN